MPFCRCNCSLCASLCLSLLSVSLSSLSHTLSLTHTLSFSTLLPSHSGKTSLLFQLCLFYASCDQPVSGFADVYSQKCGMLGKLLSRSVMPIFLSRPISYARRRIIWSVICPGLIDIFHLQLQKYVNVFSIIFFALLPLLHLHILLLFPRPLFLSSNLYYYYQDDDADLSCMQSSFLCPITTITVYRSFRELLSFMYLPLRSLRIS